MVLDSVEFHKTEAVKTKAKELNTILSFVPPGLTHKLQPLDVSFNKPFKQRVQELQDSMSIAERPDRDLHEWTTSERRIFMTKVVATAYNLLHEEKSEMVRKSFICTGINLHPNGEDDAAISIKGLDSSDIDLSDWRTIPTPGMDGLEAEPESVNIDTEHMAENTEREAEFELQLHGEYIHTCTTSHTSDIPTIVAPSAAVPLPPPPVEPLLEHSMEPFDVDTEDVAETAENDDEAAEKEDEFELHPVEWLFDNNEDAEKENELEMHPVGWLFENEEVAEREDEFEMHPLEWLFRDIDAEEVAETAPAPAPLPHLCTSSTC